MTALGDVTFNEWVDDARIVAVKVGGWHSPPLRGGPVARPRDHGGFSDLTFYGPRFIGIVGTIRVRGARQLADVIDELVSASDLTDEDGEFTRGGRLAFVRRSGSLMIEEISSRLAEFDLELVAADMRRHGLDPRSQALTLEVTASGLVWPLTWPLNWGGGASGIVMVTNAGNFPARPTARIDGPVTTPRLENITAGQEAEFALTLAAGEFIDVDFDAKTVLLNGTASRYSTFRGDWWELAAGDSQIRYAAASGTGGATLKWRDAWI